jgi:hypothetical protein
LEWLRDRPDQRHFPVTTHQRVSQRQIAWRSPSTKPLAGNRGHPGVHLTLTLAYLELGCSCGEIPGSGSRFNPAQ